MGRPLHLALSTLFPLPANPSFGIFVRRRLELYNSEREVVVLCPVPWNPIFRKYSGVPKSGWRDIYGMKVYYRRYLIVPKFPFLNPLAIYLSLRGVLREMMRTRKVKMMDVHFAYPDGCVGLLAKFFLGLRYNVTVRGSDINLFHKFFGIGYLVGMGLRGAERILSVSRELAEFVCLHYGVREPVVVPNGVDTRRFHPAAKWTEERRSLGIEPEAKIVLYVGSLKEPKGIRELVEAFPLVRNRHPEAILLVIGDGPLREALERESPRGIHILGPKGEGDVALYMRCADLFCLPSHSEGCPNVVLEALASGTPVVGSDIPGIRDIVGSEKHGLFFRPGVIAEIAERLSESLDREWIRTEIAAHGATFTWDRTYEILRSLDTSG